MGLGDLEWDFGNGDIVAVMEWNIQGVDLRDNTADTLVVDETMVQVVVVVLV